MSSISTIEKDFSMLILSRKASEKLTIGNDITVTICKIKDGQVKLGIDAPADVLVMRDDAATEPPRTKNKPRVSLP
tara:strand:- start:3297 stop:3524 length:228 start_codon:yes stop_codon:yes gene_type:complete